MSPTLLPACLVIPLRHHEAACLRQSPDFLANIMGMTYTGDPATAHSRLMLTFTSQTASMLSGALGIIAEQRQDEPGMAQLAWVAPSSILKSLRRRVDAEYVGYRASEVMGDLTKGGEWLHNERLTPFDGKTAYQLVTEEGRTDDVLRYLASLGAGVTS